MFRHASEIGWFKRAALFAAVGLLSLAVQPASAQPGNLTFFKNYFVTGDYVTGGVGLRGTGVLDPVSGLKLATGSIPITLPANQNKDILGAFLYWQTVLGNNESDFPVIGATFNGHNIQDLPFIVNPAGTSPCWSSGGGTGSPEGAHKMKVYRADVLRFLPIKITVSPNANRIGQVVDPGQLAAGESGKRWADGSHTVTLPDAGSGNSTPSTAGVSLVVIYKDLSPSATLKSIVIYNGGWTMDNDSNGLTQTIQGFYQASAANGAKMTHIVGDGQANKYEQVVWNGQVIAPVPGPFTGALGPVSDPAWDTVTFGDGTPYPFTLAANAASGTVTVDKDSLSTFDCLSWGAIIFSTAVQDTDGDGLLDVWESSNPPVTDPNGQPLPNLALMGANPYVKDVFVEVGAMFTDLAHVYSNPTQGAVGVHDHFPTYAALKMVGDAFKDAPVSNPVTECAAQQPPGVYPCLATGIKMHFDVGNRYPTKALNTACPSPSNEYIVPWCADASNPARGGESILETACVPGPSNNNTCAFLNYPGTVGWKSGFRALRDEILVADNPATPADETVRRFDRNRKDIFHYALFPHALGVQRLDDPNTSGDESVSTCSPADCDPYTPGTQLTTPVPSGASGTADGGGSGGADLMVSLGFFDGFVGSDFVQASTLMHELGHNFRLRHGPAVTDPVTFAVTVKTCPSNYQSIMSYLSQMRGLVCDAASPALPGSRCSGLAAGTGVIDYSRLALNPLNEFSLSEQTPGLGSLAYRTRWYSALSLADSDLGTTGSARHCSGGFKNDPSETGFRIDGTNLFTIDWNANLIIDAGTNTGGQDVNFNGGPYPLPSWSVDHPTDGPFSGFNDWSAVDLRQVGSRRNIASHSVEDAVGPLSLDQGQGDNGQGDNGQGDNGQGDNGQGDNGQGDNGQGDNGQGDNGQGDNGAPPEMDPSTSRTNGGNVPNGPVTAAVINRNIVVTWQKPNVTKDLVRYHVWRVTGTVVDSTTWGTRKDLGSPSPNQTATTFTDLTAKNNVFYVYFIVAEYLGNEFSPRSEGSNAIKK